MLQFRQLVVCFVLLSALVIALYCLCTFLVHRCRPGISAYSGLQEQPQDFDTLNFKLEMLDLKSSKNTTAESRDRKDQSLTWESSEIVVTVMMAFLLAGKVKLVESRVVSFHKTIDNGKYVLRFRKVIEEVQLDEEEGAGLLDRIERGVGFRRVLCVQPQECQPNVEYPFQRLRVVGERQFQIVSEEQAWRIYESQF